MRDADAGRVPSRITHRFRAIAKLLQARPILIRAAVGPVVIGNPGDVTSGGENTSAASRLYTINPSTGVATTVGGPFAIPLQGTEPGVDFNPVPDRLRVVSNTGQNLRVNPNNGAVVDGDPNTASIQADGDLVFVVAPLNVQMAGPVGFDISRSGQAYASFTDFSGASNLFLVNLGSGALTRIGTAAGGEQFRGFAIVP